MNAFLPLSTAKPYFSVFLPRNKNILDWLLFDFIFNFSLPEEYSIISRVFPFHSKNASEYNVLYSYI